MEDIINRLLVLVPDEMDLDTMLKASVILTVCTLVLALIGRLVFGKKSVLSQSLSAAIGILFIYAATVVIYSYGLDLKMLVSPLPFITLQDEQLLLFSFFTADYIAICGEVLNMIILAFLVNLVNGLLDRGKNIFVWLVLHIVSVALAMLLHAFVCNLIYAFLPEGLITWAPVILLGILVLMLAVGSLKFLVGAAIATVNPIIALLYTFFFATFIGKQLSKAILTTALLAGLVMALEYIGCTVISIGATMLTAYIPLMVIILLLWFITGKLMHK